MKALRRLDATGAPVTFDSLAHEAGVSRSWLYAQPDLRAEIERLRDRNRTGASAPTVPDRQRASDGSLLRRLEAATERIRRLQQDNRELREALADALGQRRSSHVTGHHRDTPGKTATEPHRPIPTTTTRPAASWTPPTKQNP